MEENVNKKKIAFLHFAYPPNIGGVESFIKEQSEIFFSLGYDVLILTGSGKNNNKSIRLVEITQLQSLYNTDPQLLEEILSKGINNDGFKKLSNEIEAKINEFLFDREIIIVHNMLSLIFNVPFIFAFKEYIKKHPGKKVISWVHDHKYIGFDRIRINDFSLHKDVSTLITEKIAGVTYVTISETLKRLLTKVTNLEYSEITVISNGINIKEFLEIDDDIWRLVEEKSLRNKFPIILSPVNIIDRKNIEYSLDIIYNLKKLYPNLIYIVTGMVSHYKEREKYYQSLLKKIKELELENNVLFLSQHIKRSMHKSEIHDFYSLCDMIFYFSKSENFGLPLLEATLAKTPILLSNLDVFKEIGNENFSYVDTEKTSAKEAAKNIVDLLENNKIILMNRIVKDNYDLTDIVKKNLIPLINKK